MSMWVTEDLSRNTKFFAESCQLLWFFHLFANMILPEVRGHNSTCCSKFWGAGDNSRSAHEMSLFQCQVPLETVKKKERIWD